MLTTLAVSSLAAAPLSADPPSAASFIEVKTWYLHNTPENQDKRVSQYLEHGLSPALGRAGAKLAGAFSTLIGPDGPFYLTLTEFPSLAAMQAALEKISADSEHASALQQLSSGNGLPFVRVKSSLVRSFSGMPQAAIPKEGERPAGRIFELRTYESQTFLSLSRKVGMFNGGEMQIFQRLGMRPVFFGETVIGERQPNLMYMLTYDNLAARDTLWKSFGSDPAWKKLSSQPEFANAEIVANISNILLSPLSFSLV